MPAKKRPEQPILVPTDFSVPSETALVFASELAEALQCPLLVLHVVHDPGEAPGYYAVSGRDQSGSLKESEPAHSIDRRARPSWCARPGSVRNRWTRALRSV